MAIYFQMTPEETYFLTDAMKTPAILWTSPLSKALKWTNTAPVAWETRPLSS